MVEFGIRALNSYDGRNALRIELVAVRQHCKNHMTRPSNSTISVFKIHRGEFDIERFERDVGRMLKRTYEDIKEMKKMMTRQIL